MEQPDPLSALAWLVEAGADEALSDMPVDRFSATAVPTSPSPLVAEGKSNAARSTWEGGDTQKSPLPNRSTVRPVPQAGGEPQSDTADHIGRATEIAARCNSLEELRAALEGFDGLALKRSAKNTVFADGTPDHHIMLIGEAPGAEEDRQGKPFVGRAGQLLDKMLAAIALDRKTNVYITNVLNWRPPGNRDPSPVEAATCLPFLRRHIELAAPKIIILLGATAVRHVMGKTDGIMRTRGHWLEYHVNGAMVPVMPTLHPAYLLRQPAHKKLAWHDLQQIAAKVKTLGLLENTGGGV